MFTRLQRHLSARFWHLVAQAILAFRRSPWYPHWLALLNRLERISPPPRWMWFTFPLSALMLGFLLS